MSNETVAPIRRFPTPPSDLSLSSLLWGGDLRVKVVWGPRGTQIFYRSVEGSFWGLSLSCLKWRPRPPEGCKFATTIRVPSSPLALVRIYFITISRLMKILYLIYSQVSAPYCWNFTKNIVRSHEQSGCWVICLNAIVRN